MGKYWAKARLKLSRENTPGIWDFNGLRWLRPYSFAACTIRLFRLESLPVCSSPDRCRTVLASFTVSGSPLRLQLPVYTSQQWPPVSCPLRTFKQGHPYHMLPVISSSLTLHKENRELLTSCLKPQYHLDGIAKLGCQFGTDTGPFESH